MVEKIENVADELDSFLREIFEFGQAMRNIEGEASFDKPGAVESHKIATTNELARFLQALPDLQDKFTRLPSRALEILPQKRETAESVRRSLARIYIECSQRKFLSDEWAQLRGSDFAPNNLDQINTLAEQMKNCEDAIHVEANKLLKIAYKLRSAFDLEITE
jgi:hypothetical protein